MARSKTAKGGAKKKAGASTGRPAQDWSTTIKKAVEQKKQPPQWPGGGADAWKHRSPSDAGRAQRSRRSR